MQTFLLSFPCSQHIDLGTTVQSLHCIGLFPSTCALEPVRLCDSSLQLSLKHTQIALRSHLYVITSSDVVGGRGTTVIPLSE